MIFNLHKKIKKYDYSVPYLGLMTMHWKAVFKWELAYLKKNTIVYNTNTFFSDRKTIYAKRNLTIFCVKLQKNIEYLKTAYLELNRW